MEEIWDFIARGGVLMAPIFGCSVVALGIFLERIMVLQRRNIMPPPFVAYVGRLITDGKLSEAEALAASGESSIAMVLQAGLKHRGRRREVLKEAFEEAGRQEVALLERYVGALGTIANIAPLLGLLGTVAGMIQAFQQVVLEVAQKSTVDAGHLAAGIWAALITTAAGLAVAIPTFLAYRYLQSRIDLFAMEMEYFGLQMVDLLERGEGPPAPTPAASGAPDADAEDLDADGDGRPR